MNTEITILAERLLERGFDDLTPSEKRVMKRAAHRLSTARNVNTEFAESRSFGDRIADQVASFGGSWTFILIAMAVLMLWICLNTVILTRAEAFDPYPYVFLNLILSMLAALQAPIIMMSQNRQAEKDRIAARHDYEVNLRAQLEIIRLHRRLDRIIDRLDTMTNTVERDPPT